MESLTTTNVWLAILAVVSLLEFLMIMAAGVLAYRVYRQVMVAVQTVERLHIAPVRARVDGILDEVQVMTEKVRRLQESVEETLRLVAGTGGQVAEAVRSRTWPILGLIHGIRAAANTVTGNGKKNPAVDHYGT
jgi:uncharacterized protein YoxC